MNNVIHLPSSGQGGSGTGDGMEARIAKLEAGVSHLERDVSELRGDMRDVRDRLAKLEEKVSHLPGKGFVVTALILSLAVVAGLVTFQSNIQGLVGNRPTTASAVPSGG